MPARIDYRLYALRWDHYLGLCQQGDLPISLDPGRNRATDCARSYLRSNYGGVRYWLRYRLPPQRNVS